MFKAGDRVMNGGSALWISCGHVRRPLDEGSKIIEIAMHRRVDKRRHSVSIGEIDARAGIEESLHHGVIPLRQSDQQRGPSIVPSRIRVDAIVEANFEERLVARRDGAGERLRRKLHPSTTFGREAAGLEE